MDDLPARHFVEHLQRGVRVTDAEKDHEQDVAGAEVGRDVELGWRYMEESGSEVEAAHGAKRVEERVEGASGRAGIEKDGREKKRRRDVSVPSTRRSDQSARSEKAARRDTWSRETTGAGSWAVAPTSAWERATTKTGSESGSGGATWKSAWHGRAEEQAADGGRW